MPRIILSAPCWVSLAPCFTIVSEFVQSEDVIGGAGNGCSTSSSQQNRDFSSAVVWICPSSRQCLRRRRLEAYPMRINLQKDIIFKDMFFSMCLVYRGYLVDVVGIFKNLGSFSGSPNHLYGSMQHNLSQNIVTGAVYGDGECLVGNILLKKIGNGIGSTTRHCSSCVYCICWSGIPPESFFETIHIRNYMTCLCLDSKELEIYAHLYLFQK